MLHQFPDLSGLEANTAQRIVTFCHQFKPNHIFTGVGGHGVILHFGSMKKNVIMLRCELDAVPVCEDPAFTPYSSQNPAVSHKCGHDGHMAILAGVAAKLSLFPFQNISVALLFQPDEETGKGSERVLEHIYFKDCRPEKIFALHNVPGVTMGRILSCEGTFSCASRGMTLVLNGRSAHAAQPETGNSPAIALSELISFATDLKNDPSVKAPLSFCTVVGARLGDKAFGTAPAAAELYLTLRSETDAEMKKLSGLLERKIDEIAKRDMLGYTIEYNDVFNATVNEKVCYELIHRAAGRRFTEMQTPFRWSEDFGRYNQEIPGAMFGLGAGETTAPLHDSLYDFPDQLIGVGVEFYLSLLKLCDDDMA